MRPDERELDDEIRGHLALAIHERMARGESAEAARRGALADLGYVPQVRDSMRGVWYGRWFDAGMGFVQDIRVGLRSLRRAKGLSAAVVVTLALGIGANAAIFSVVRTVLLRPLVNRGEDRLIYIRQGASGPGAANLTFSIPEIADITARATTVAAFGDFSTFDFTMIGLGEPRVVHAGLVSGSYFDVMGLRPVLGRLLGPADDGPGAAGAVVLTHRYWSTVLAGDPAVIGKTIRLGSRAAAIVGVLEPSIPYPAATEIIANIVTSPHHLDATMVTERTHRMTELFGRLAPGASVEAARAELEAVHAAIVTAHGPAYAAHPDVRLQVTPFRDAVTAEARPILLVLLGAAGLVFLIACANVANLLLARAVKREGELAVRAALGASRTALRRTLLAESLVLCGTGAALGVLLARPLVSVVAQFTAPFSARALEATVDASLPWIGAGLAVAAAIALAFVPRLPMAHAVGGSTLESGGLRVTPRLARRLKAFAVAQVACSFVLLLAAGTLLSALAELVARGKDDLRQVLVVDVPLPLESFGAPAIAFFEDAMRRVHELPGVQHVAASNVVPWRDVGTFGPFSVSVEGHTPVDGEDPPRALLRNVTPDFFATIGLPLIAGRGFTQDDRGGKELVVIVSQSIADRLFPDGSALNRQLWWNEPMFGNARRRIVGVVADLNDQDLSTARAPAVYHPFRQLPFASRLFVRTDGDPYALIPSITRIVRDIAAEQPVERAATLSDVRAQVLTADRVTASVVTGFASVALLIAAVGLAGVLAFLVSVRTREFGIRLAVGSTPLHLLARVVREGATVVIAGIAIGALVSAMLAGVALRVVDGLQTPRTLPMLAAAGALLASAVIASLVPAARASKVDVLRALRTE